MEKYTIKVITQNGNESFLMIRTESGKTRKLILTDNKRERTVIDYGLNDNYMEQLLLEISEQYPWSRVKIFDMYGDFVRECHASASIRDSVASDLESKIDQLQQAFKINYICTKLGLERTAYYNKRKSNSFKPLEVEKLVAMHEKLGAM